MNESLVVPVGALFAWDETLLHGSTEIRNFWYAIYAEYSFRIRESSIVQKAQSFQIKQVNLLVIWLEKRTKKVLKEIPLADEDGIVLYYTRKVLDGWYYLHVYCFVLDIFLSKIEERQDGFRYFVNILKKQGWVMSKQFERALLNDGVFLTREKDLMKRIPYDLMRQFRIVMR